MISVFNEESPLANSHVSEVIQMAYFFASLGIYIFLLLSCFWKYQLCRNSMRRSASQTLSVILLSWLCSSAFCGADQYISHK